MGFDPKGKLFFALLPLVITLLASKVAISLVTLVGMAIITVRFSSVNFRNFASLFAIPLGFLAIGTVTIIIGRYSIGTDLIVSFNLENYAYGISRDSLIMGINIVCRSLASVSCMYFISLNIPMVELFGVLRFWRVPRLIVSLMELIYRYIFVVLEESSKIWIAQNSRGACFGFSQRLRGCSYLISSLLQRSFARSYRVMAALESRGYDGEFYALEKSYNPSKIFYGLGLGLSFILVVIWVVGVVVL